MTIVFFRFATAALLVYAYARARSIPIPSDIRSWLSFAGMGLLNNLIPASLIVWGQTMIPSGLASVIIATTPIFSIIAIHLSSADEQLTLAKISGMVLGLVGVSILFRLIVEVVQPEGGAAVSVPFCPIVLGQVPILFAAHAARPAAEPHAVCWMARIVLAVILSSIT